MKYINYLIVNLSHLKYFELHAEKGAFYLTNGKRWEDVTRGLDTFNFIFYTRLSNIEETLETYRSPFWMKRRWFVTYDNNRLFSVPRFATKYSNGNFQRPRYSTVIDEKILHNNITILELSEPWINIKYYFTQVRTLKVNGSIQFDILLSIIDVDRVEHLILSSPMPPALSNVDRLLTMKGIRKLTILTNPFQLIEQLRGEKFQNIRTLNIDYTFIVVKRYQLKQLFSIFPNVERLRIKSVNKAIMICMIDGFQCLSNASFSFSCLSETDENNWQIRPEQALNGSHRLRNSNYTCRYEHSHVDAWIGEQVSQINV